MAHFEFVRLRRDDKDGRIERRDANRAIRGVGPTSVGLFFAVFIR
jgi:hypothetical protein